MTTSSTINAMMTAIVVRLGERREPTGRGVLLLSRGSAVTGGVAGTGDSGYGGTKGVASVAFANGEGRTAGRCGDTGGIGTTGGNMILRGAICTSGGWRVEEAS